LKRAVFLWYAVLWYSKMFLIRKEALICLADAKK